VANHMASMDVDIKESAFVLGQIPEQFDPEIQVPLSCPILTLEGITFTPLEQALSLLAFVPLINDEAIDDLEIRFQRGEDILVSVAKQTPAHLPVLNVLGEIKLTIYQFNFSAEMDCEVCGTTVRTEESDCVNAVFSPTAIAHKLSQQVLDPCPRTGTTTPFNFHRDPEKPPADLAVEILRHALQLRGCVSLRGPADLV